MDYLSRKTSSLVERARAFVQHVVSFIRRLGPIELALILVGLFFTGTFFIKVGLDEVGLPRPFDLTNWIPATLLFISLILVLFCALAFFFGGSPEPPIAVPPAPIPLKPETKWTLFRDRGLFVFLIGAGGLTAMAVYEHNTAFRVIGPLYVGWYIIAHVLSAFSLRWFPLPPAISSISAPIRQRLDDRLWKIIDAHQTAIPSVELWALILKTSDDIYNSVQFPVVPQGPEGDALRPVWGDAPERMFQAIAESMAAYLRALPVSESAPFHAPLAERINLSSAFYGMTAPFRALPFPVPLNNVVHQNAVRMTGVLGFKGPGLAYPQDHPGPAVQAMIDFAGGTPFFNLLNIQVPFSPYTDEDRFSHQWVMADQGMGKTVLISSQIQADLDRVAKGECSVFVMDPKNKELGRFLPRLKRFAPGGDLHGKLIYLEPDEQYPLALNIFDFQQSDYREAEQMTLTFMAGFADMSEQMKNILKNSLQALQKIPNATIFTFQELLFADRTSNGFDRLAGKYPELRQLDKTTVKFLTSSMHDGNYSPSLGALKARLDGFTADPLFKKMFSRPRSLVNLADQLAEGKVVIVNADRTRLQDATEPFGRYFISRLLQTSYTRRAGRTKPLPVFAYIDECHDFVAHDVSITQLLAQARDQNVSLCLAHQAPYQVADIRGALETCAIKCRAVRKTVWDYAVRETHHVITPPPTDFSKMDAMTPEEWGVIQKDMRERFSRPPKPEAPRTGGFDASKDVE
jgi:hypothetical protein